MLTEQSVAAAYQLLLGRLPESDEIVRRFVEQESFDILRDAILGSDEFAGRVADRPGMLDLHPWVKAGCRTTRLACRQLEHLASLNLPLWGRTVLLPGGESGLHASFFVDRLCKVVIPMKDQASAAVVRDRLSRLRHRHSADGIQVRCLDLCGSAVRGGSDACQIVASQSALPGPKDVARFIANLSRICTEILILDVRVGFGSGEALTVAHETVRDQSMEVAVPTRQWLWARLAQEFAHVYVPRTQPCHEDYALSWRGVHHGAASSRAIFVAARVPLDEACLSPALLDVQSRQPAAMALR